MCPLHYIILSSDPFASFRQGFAEVIMGLFGIVLVVSLGVTVVHVIQGEQESAKKMFKWIMASAGGMILLSVISKL